MTNSPKRERTRCEATRRCCHCGKELPATSEFFPRWRNGKDGLAKQCKECMRGYYQRHRKEKLEYAKEYREKNKGPRKRPFDPEKAVRDEHGRFVYTTGGGRYKRAARSGKNKAVHRLVYEEHFGSIPEGHIVHHKNGNKKDNRPENLEAITQAEHNRIHAKDRPIWNKGLSKESSKKWGQTLAKAKVVRNKNYFSKCKEVRDLVICGFSYSQVGKMLGISRGVVYSRYHRYFALIEEYGEELLHVS